MKLRYSLSLLAVAGLIVLALLPVSQADEPERPKPAKVVDPGSLPEVQDVIFFTEKRPVLMRMRLFIDGKPAAERWEEFQKKLFAYLDTDGDGFLTKKEAEHILDPRMVIQAFTGNPVGIATSNPPPLEELLKEYEDVQANKDARRLSPAALASYYRRTGAGPFAAITGASQDTTGDQLTNALFDALDTNKDGKLTKEKLRFADKVLISKFDDNDDELITPQELLAVASDPYAPVRQRPGAPLNTGQTSILLIPKEDPGRPRIAERRKIAKDVLSKYDKDQNGKLSREELGFPNELFDVLRNEDNKGNELTADELLRWVIASNKEPRFIRPDMECTVRLGRVDDQAKFIEPANSGKGPYGLQMNPTSSSTAVLGLIGTEVTVLRGGVPRFNIDAGRQPPLTQVCLQHFKSIDTAGRGFVTLKDLEMPRYQALRSVFLMALHEDANKLTLKELQAFLDVAAVAIGAQVAIVYTDNGQGLFDMLDSNNDGRLSIREMRGAWARMAPNVKDGCLTKADIPRQYSLVVGGSPTQQIGRQVLMQAVNMDRMATNPRGTPLEPRGPLWFRKMDVNGDGDVSEREFLGSKEDFRRINTSGDGLISVEEAIKADAWFREKSHQK